MISGLFVSDYLDKHRTGFVHRVGAGEVYKVVVETYLRFIRFLYVNQDIEEMIDGSHLTYLDEPVVCQHTELAALEINLSISLTARKVRHHMRMVTPSWISLLNMLLAHDDKII